MVAGLARAGKAGLNRAQIRPCGGIAKAIRLAGGLIAMSPFLTSKENIVVDLIYDWLGESRINRTYEDYMEIASRFPKVEACHAYVNQRLREMADAGNAPFEICYFKAGDRYIWYKDFPTSLSRETVRCALLKMSMPRSRVTA